MNADCPVCGKRFYVLYPNLWVYKREHRFLCSYGCMRKIDRGENMAFKLTEEQKQEAVRIAMGGKSPIKFIESCGVNNPSCSWHYIKKGLKEKDPETWAKLPNQFRGTEAAKQPEPLPAPAPEPVANGIEYRVTGISTMIGDFQYYAKNGYLDWTPIGDNAVVSLQVEEWRELLKILPEVNRILGVKG